MPELETRSAAITGYHDDQANSDVVGQITARLVPWDQPTQLIPGIREQFARGSVTIDPDQPPMLFRDHREPIGPITGLDDREDGCYITADILNTAQGRDTMTLVRGGVLDRVSIGFEPVTADETRDQGGVLITQTRTIIREGSIVPFPAYSGARITEHRHQTTPTTTTQETPMTDTLTRADLDGLATRADLDAMSRRLDTITTSTPATATIDTRSAGQILKAITGGDQDTIAAANRWQDRAAYAGATLDDMPTQLPQGIESLVQIVNNANPLASLFRTKSLPAMGMSVNFLKIKAKDIKVGKQAAMGKDLPGPSKVTFETASAPIEIYGGWTELDLPRIQRMEVPELDTTLTAMAVEIGVQRANQFATALAEAVTARKAIQSITVAAATDADAWSDAIVDAQISYLDSGLPMDGLLVAADVFKSLRKLKDGKGGYVMTTYGQGINQVGVINDLSGQLGPIKVSLWHKAAAGSATFYAADAASSRNNGVVQLQDTNVINLTGQWSLHQLSAVCIERPDLLLPVTIGA